MFNIRLGIPEVYEYWKELSDKVKLGEASKQENAKYRKLGKTFKLLSQDPKYPSLNSHPIDQLSKRYGMKVWESYVENKKPAAGRIFWVYGPEKEDITIIAIEPHPNDKTYSYVKIKLSDLN